MLYSNSDSLYSYIRVGFQWEKKINKYLRHIHMPLKEIIIQFKKNNKNFDVLVHSF